MGNSDDITSLKGVGEKTAALLSHLDIHTVEDMIEYYPKDYKTYPQPVAIGSLRSGQTAAVCGTITDAFKNSGRPGKKIITCHVSDGSGILSLTWFNALFLKNVLRKGGHYVFFGKVREYKGMLTMEHPEYFEKEAYKNVMGKEFHILFLFQ